MEYRISGKEKNSEASFFSIYAVMGTVYRTIQIAHN